MQTIDLRLLDIQMEQLSQAITEKQRLASILGGSDIPHALRKNEVMTDITREEFNARMETIEVKMDARVESVSSKIDGFLAAQLERDKRYELLAERVTKAAEGAEEAAKQAATVKSNYWAAVGVQLFAVAAIIVGAYFATQANTLSAIATTLSAYQAGKSESAPAPLPQPPAVPAPSVTK